MENHEDAGAELMIWLDLKTTQCPKCKDFSLVARYREVNGLIWMQVRCINCTSLAYIPKIQLLKTTADKWKQTHNFIEKDPD